MPITRSNSAPITVAQWIDSRRPSFSEEDLVEALNSMERSRSAVGLPPADRDFWERHSGIATSDSAAEAALSNVVAKVRLEAEAWTADEVAKHLGVSPSTVRHYRLEKKLHALTIRGKLRFPLWQFSEQGSVPSLAQVLHALPDDLHPQTIAGFFTTPQPDLVHGISGLPPREWLLEGGSPTPVVELAKDLAAGR